MMEYAKLKAEIERLQTEFNERTCPEFLFFSGGVSIHCILENDGHEWHEGRAYKSSIENHETQLKWRQVK